MTRKIFIMLGIAAIILIAIAFFGGNHDTTQPTKEQAPQMEPTQQVGDEPSIRKMPREGSGDKYKMGPGPQDTTGRPGEDMGRPPERGYGNWYIKEVTR